MADVARTVGGEPERVSIAELRLDWRNPRLPPDRQRPDASQLDLALYIDKRYNPLEVAESIARHGFFESEPLIAVVENGFHVVVEGNRRLTALLGLSDPAFRDAMAKQNRGWSRLQLRVPLPDRLPVVVVDERKSITPLLGFRHISGIKEWEPFAQARYIASLVEDDGQDLEEVADLVGRPVAEVKAMYRDHEIIRQAQEYFKIDTSRVVQDFGVFNAAMAIRNLRTYIGAPTPGGTNTVDWPVPPNSEERLRRLIVYIYGDARGRGRVLPESRMLRDLGRVLADSSGRAEVVLRDTQSLGEAVEALTAPGELALKRLNAALNGLRRVLSDGPTHLDLEGSSVVEDLRDAVAELADRTDESSAGRTDP